VAGHYFNNTTQCIAKIGSTVEMPTNHGIHSALHKRNPNYCGVPSSGATLYIVSGADIVLPFGVPRYTCMQLNECRELYSVNGIERYWVMNTFRCMN